MLGDLPGAWCTSRANPGSAGSGLWAWPVGSGHEQCQPQTTVGRQSDCHNPWLYHLAKERRRRRTSRPIL
jgi:hypothetical protein